MSPHFLENQPTDITSSRKFEKAKFKKKRKIVHFCRIFFFKKLNFLLL